MKKPGGVTRLILYISILVAIIYVGVTADIQVAATIVGVGFLIFLGGKVYRREEL